MKRACGIAQYHWVEVRRYEVCVPFGGDVLIKMGRNVIRERCLRIIIQSTPERKLGLRKDATCHNVLRCTHETVIAF